LRQALRRELGLLLKHLDQTFLSKELTIASGFDRPIGIEEEQFALAELDLVLLPRVIGEDAEGS
jgi:hypothetical protein